MDRLTAAARSELMRRVRGKNTGPELIVRRLLHSMGYRFRLHRRDLPGTPDIVFGPAHKAIMVHGCFWHRHIGCRLSSEPKTRQEFWRAKFARNVARDEANQSALRNLGWDILVVWQCETKNREALTTKLAEFLDPTRSVSFSR